jgi:hypothetical protein
MDTQTTRRPEGGVRLPGSSGGKPSMRTQAGGNRERNVSQGGGAGGADVVREGEPEAHDDRIMPCRGGLGIPSNSWRTARSGSGRSRRRTWRGGRPWLRHPPQDFRLRLPDPAPWRGVFAGFCPEAIFAVGPLICNNLRRRSRLESSQERLRSFSARSGTLRLGWPAH